ncbi:MAG TPA: hypothetical protein VLV86_10255, partial [Vicinamibacterales bacterium]|nr:hypothetical protein [Vicinamibacterales bacterium]
VMSLVLLHARFDASAGDIRPTVPLPAESAGWDRVVDGLITALDHADVLVLGEVHRRKVDGELRARLVRHPEFARRVRFVVCEGVDTETQRILDRYVDGGDVSDSEMQAIARVGPTFTDLFAAIRDVNRSSAARDRVRVLGGRDADDRKNWDAWSVERIRDQVLSTKQKALVVYGAGHVWRSHGEITQRLERLIPGRVFVAETLTNFAPKGRGQAPPEYTALGRAIGTLDAALQTRERPVLVLLGKSPRIAALPADPFYLGQAMFGPDVTLGDIDDAIVSFGANAEAGL